MSSFFVKNVDFQHRSSTGVAHLVNTGEQLPQPGRFPHYRFQIRIPHWSQRYERTGFDELAGTWTLLGVGLAVRKF